VQGEQTDLDPRKSDRLKCSFNEKRLESGNCRYRCPSQGSPSERSDVGARYSSGSHVEDMIGWDTEDPDREHEELRKGGDSERRRATHMKYEVPARLRDDVREMDDAALSGRSSLSKSCRFYLS
jgi:hypothetical protein